MITTQSLNKVQQFNTSAVLAAAATYTSPTIDTVPDNGGHIGRVTGRVYASHTGNVYMDVSDDGTTWDQIYTAAVSAATTLMIDQIPCCRYARFRYTNGATLQTTFRFSIYSRTF